MKLLSALAALPKISLRASAAVCAGLIAAALVAYVATPRLTEVTDAPSLDGTVPRKFADWTELPNPFVQVSLSTGTSTDQPYDQTVMRTYVNSAGQQVMLALAWGKRQRQEVKIHRPDLCYVAQGFKISSLQTVRFDQVVPSSQIRPIGKHMVAVSPQAVEAISYWMRIGSLYSEDAFQTRSHIFRQGLKGQIPDGILVRASMRMRTTDDVANAWPVLDQFLKDLTEATPIATRPLLLGQSSI